MSYNYCRCHGTEPEECRTIINNLQDGYLRTNNDGIITMVSPSMVYMYGAASLEDLIGTHTSALYKNISDRSLALEKMNEEGRVVDFETEMLRSDGSFLPVSINAQYFYDNKGQIQGIEAFIRDASERKEAAEKLRKLNNQLEQKVIQRTRFYTLVAGINDAIAKYRDRHELLNEICKIIVETGGFRLAWIGTLNPNSLEIIPEASCGETAYLEGIRIKASEEPAGEGPSGRAVVEGRHIVCVDFEQDPRMLPWRERARAHGIRSSSVFPLFSGSEVIGEIAIYSDKPSCFTEEEISLLLSVSNNISFALNAIAIDQKRLEAEESLRKLNEGLERTINERTSALEEANRELEAFSYSVSHDLRAPLRHMSGFAKLLQQDLGAQLDRKALGYSKAIIKAAEKMSELIDDLLSFSHIGRATLNLEKLSLNALVNSLLHEMKAEVKGRDIRWNIGHLPDTYGDQSLIRMVLVNLISNAVKFTGKKEHAEITIRCSKNGMSLFFPLATTEKDLI
jgi:PAS domain S-box-containing protein